MTTTTNLENLSKDELINLVKKQAQKGSSIKVSQKGGVSVYGLGRFPVTIYASQWERLLSQAEEIKAFIDIHKAELSVKA